MSVIDLDCLVGHDMPPWQGFLENIVFARQSRLLNTLFVTQVGQWPPEADAMNEVST